MRVVIVVKRLARYLHTLTFATDQQNGGALWGSGAGVEMRRASRL